MQASSIQLFKFDHNNRGNQGYRGHGNRDRGNPDRVNRDRGNRGSSANMQFDGVRNDARYRNRRQNRDNRSSSRMQNNRRATNNGPMSQVK